MVMQLLIGGGLIVLSTFTAATSWWGLEGILDRTRDWVVPPPHGPRLAAVLGLAMIWTLMMLAVSVMIWALAFLSLDIFPTLEASVYFALVAFTTLGFGDILLPEEWRLLSGMSAANGLLIFGLMTAMLVETLRETRLRQRDYNNHIS